MKIEYIQNEAVRKVSLQNEALHPTCTSCVPMRLFNTSIDAPRFFPANQCLAQNVQRGDLGTDLKHSNAFPKNVVPLSHKPLICTGALDLDATIY